MSNHYNTKDNTEVSHVDVNGVSPVNSINAMSHINSTPLNANPSGSNEAFHSFTHTVEALALQKSSIGKGKIV